MQQAGCKTVIVQCQWERFTLHVSLIAIWPPRCTVGMCSGHVTSVNGFVYDGHQRSPEKTLVWHTYFSSSTKSFLWLQALSEAGFSSSLRSVDDATGASNSVVRQKREERKRWVHTATLHLFTKPAFLIILVCILCTSSLVWQRTDLLRSGGCLQLELRCQEGSSAWQLISKHAPLSWILWSCEAHTVQRDHDECCKTVNSPIWD